MTVSLGDYIVEPYNPIAAGRYDYGYDIRATIYHQDIYSET